jgi:hypothetical protein
VGAVGRVLADLLDQVLELVESFRCNASASSARPEVGVIAGQQVGGHLVEVPLCLALQ